MRQNLLVFTALSSTTTVFAYYRASVPCYDASHQDQYHTACTVTNSLGASDSWRSTPNRLFTCDGNVPGIYWNTLQSLGLSTCVCGYVSSDKVNWYFTQSYGVCNGVCTSTSFTCDGTNPTASGSTNASPTTSLASSSTTPQPSASSSSSASSRSIADSPSTVSVLSVLVTLGTLFAPTMLLHGHIWL